jgi:hypothetical protein
MVAELGRFLGSEILLLVRVQVFLHLLHNVFGLMIVLDIQVCRGFGNFLGVTALRAELPLLEAIHVGERAARGTPDDEVHDKQVMRVIVIKIYRRQGWKNNDCAVPAVPAGPGDTGQPLSRCETKSLYQPVVS